MQNFVLIIGAAKSGTTSLFYYLAEHPEISSCSVKEPEFFTDDEKLSKGWTWYQNLWNWEPETQKIALEASTSYTKIPYFPNAAERIAKMPASFRFIYLMRNPLERIQSHYSHGQIAKWETTNFDWNKEKVSEELVNSSSYGKQIAEYYKRFPSNRIKLLLFEEFTGNKLGCLKDVCEFLDVDPKFQFRKTDYVYNRGYDRITSPLFSRLDRSDAVRRIASLLPHKVKTSVKSAITKPGVKSHELSPEMREESLKRLKPDLEILRDEYGVNISRWGIDI